MTDNKGSAYRTRAVVTAGLFIIALAVGVVLYGVGAVGAVGFVGVVVLLAGVILAAASFTYSKKPDKFGPSEADYRLVAGVIAAVAGAVILLLDGGAEWYVALALALVVVAVLGIAMALKNNTGE